MVPLITSPFGTHIKRCRIRKGKSEKSLIIQTPITQRFNGCFSSILILWHGLCLSDGQTATQSAGSKNKVESCRIKSKLGVKK
jgi:hypothetical protein